MKAQIQELILKYEQQRSVITDLIIKSESSTEKEEAVRRFVSGFIFDLKALQEKEIDWKELRARFFTECTDPMEENAGFIKINQTAHDLFDWFKTQITKQ